MLLLHARLLTMEPTTEQGGTQIIEDGYLEIENGRIKALGSMEDAPHCDHAIDLQGATVLPGFVDAHSHLGMWEDGLGFEGDDGNEETDPISPQMRAIDAVNPFDFCFEEARLAGITTVLTGPGSANPISGSWCALKTAGICIDDMLLNPAIGMKFALGENPKSVYHGKNEAPTTRMATAALIREELSKAKHYRKLKKKAKKDSELDPPEFDAKSEALLPLFNRKMKAFFHAHRADDIFTALRIAQEFSLDAVIVHGTESAKIVEKLTSQNVPVIAGPLLCDRSKPELRELRIDTPLRLQQAGVTTAICTDHPVIPIQYLPLSAAVAVRGGMAPLEALRAITILPAEICGIDDRVGSLKVGKDADLVLFRDDPLAVTTTPCAVMIDGNWILEELR